MMHYVRVASEKPPLVWLAQLSVQVRKGSKHNTEPRGMADGGSGQVGERCV